TVPALRRSGRLDVATDAAGGVHRGSGQGWPRRRVAHGRAAQPAPTHPAPHRPHRSPPGPRPHAPKPPRRPHPAPTTPPPPDPPRPPPKPARFSPAVLKDTAPPEPGPYDDRGSRRTTNRAASVIPPIAARYQPTAASPWRSPSCVAMYGAGDAPRMPARLN